MWWVSYWQGRGLGDKECGGALSRCEISSFPLSTGAAYKLLLSHQHHPPRHLSPFGATQKVQVFATQLSYGSTPPSSLLSSLSCYPPLLSSLTINYGVFPLDSVRLSAVFPAEGKTPPVRRTTGPTQAETLLHQASTLKTLVAPHQERFNFMFLCSLLLAACRIPS